MKKLLFLLFLFALPAFGQSPKTVESTVAFQDPQGNPLVNGVLVMDLSQPSTILGSGGQVAPIRVTINLDSTGKVPNGTVMWASDQLSPSGTSYLVQIENSNGSVVSNLRPCPWVLIGASPIDLSALQCTAIGATYPYGTTGPTGPTGPAGTPGASAAVTIANASVTGTTVNKLASITGAPSTAVITSSGASGGVVGIVTAGAGTTGNATISVQGSASCVFDNATTAGDYVQISASVNGDCTDAGASYPTGYIVGRVLATNGSPGTNAIDLFSPEIRGLVLAGASGNPVCFNSTTTVADCGVSQTTGNYTIGIVPNGDFENNSTTLPDFWFYSTQGSASPTSCAALGVTCTLTYDTSTPYQGERSLKISASSAYTGVRELQQNACTPGQRYLLRWASKYVSGAPAAFPYIFVVFNDELLGATVYSQPIIHSDTNWHVQILGFTCPTGFAGLSNFEIGSHTDNFTTTTVWELDSISVEHVPDALTLDMIPDDSQFQNNGLIAFTKIPSLSPVPVILNGDFEEPYNANILDPPGWYQLSRASTIPYAAVVTTTTANSPPSGVTAIHINGTGVTTGQVELRTTQLYAAVAGQKLVLTGNTRYVSGTTGGSAPLYIVQDSTGAQPCLSFINTSDSAWHSFSCTFTIAAGGTWFAVYTETGGSTGDEIWEIDNWQLTSPLSIPPVAPTITAHFNTSGDSITANPDASSFLVTVGTGTGTSTGTVGLSTAPNGWNCSINNKTRADSIQQTGGSTTTAVFTNYALTIGTPVNFTNSDVLGVMCKPY